MVKQRIQPKVMKCGKGEYEICTFLKHANNPNHLQGFVSTDYRNVQLIFGLLHPVFLCLVWRRQPDGSMVVYKRTHKPRHWSNNVLPCLLSLLCVHFLLWRASAVQASNNKLSALNKGFAPPPGFASLIHSPWPSASGCSFTRYTVLSSFTARTTPRFNLFSSNQFFGPQIKIKNKTPRWHGWCQFPSFFIYTITKRSSINFRTHIIYKLIVW